MAQTKKVKTRIQNKHDLEVNWITAGQNGFKPLKGEIIIYDKEYDASGNTLAKPSSRDYYYPYERFKVGDGDTNINSLPFQPHPYAAPTRTTSYDTTFNEYRFSDYWLSPSYCTEPTDCAIYHEFFYFDQAPIGFTHTKYWTIDPAWGRSLYFNIYFYYEDSLLPDGVNILVKPAPCLLNPSWTIANTVSDNSAYFNSSKISGSANCNFTISLPSDQIIGLQDFKYNSGIASIKVTKISAETVLVEPDIYIQ